MWSSSPMATHSGHPEDALSSWAPQNRPHLRLPQDCSDCPYWDCLCHVCPAGSCGVHGAGQGGLCLLYPGYPNAEPSHLQSEKQGCEGCPVEPGPETHSHVKEGGQRDSVLRAGQEDLRGVTRFNLKNLFLICVIHFFNSFFPPTFYLGLLGRTSWTSNCKRWKMNNAFSLPI